MPELFGSQPGTIYVLGLALCLMTLLITYGVYRSRMGLGLFAIHDDEDVAEVKGVPTFRYKLGAIALSSGIAGAVGSVYSINVSYVTVGETFEITTIMYPVVMSILAARAIGSGPRSARSSSQSRFTASRPGRKRRWRAAVSRWV